MSTDHAAAVHHEEHPHTNYFAIWAALMVIFAVSLGTGVVSLERHTIMAILFGAALIKAWLVLRNFMHLRGVTPWLYTMVIVPLLLAIFMVISFVPDIGLYVWRGPLDAPPAAADGHAEAPAHGEAPAH